MPYSVIIPLFSCMQMIGVISIVWYSKVDLIDIYFPVSILLKIILFGKLIFK